MEVSDSALNEILKGLITGKSQAWIISGDDEGDKATVYAMGTTCFSIEEVTGTKNLLVYSLSSYKLIKDSLWIDAMAKIKMFAKENECFKVIAFTQVDRIVEVAASLGGNIKTKLIYWEV